MGKSSRSRRLLQNKRRQGTRAGTALKNLFQIGILAGIMFLGLSLPALIQASGPEDGPAGNEPIEVGLLSEALDCLVVGETGSASGTVNLTWQGRASRARLILRAGGTEAAHTIAVNGRPVAQVPVNPAGETCGEGEIYYLDIPVEAVNNGSNRIELTADARPGDRWSAADVRLEVVGDIAYPPPPDTGGPDVGTLGYSQVYTFKLTFDSSYDGEQDQEFIAQLPVANANNCHTITPAPLVIYLHGRGSDMYEPLQSYNNFYQGPQDKGWLLASPQMRRTWPNPDRETYKDYYASLESQYDIIDTINYMVANCNVLTDRIYLYGASMGGQTALVAGAKYPHLFAAVFDNKGPSDMAVWYEDSPTVHQDRMEEECYIDIGGTPTPRTPGQNPFCYQRRSGLRFARNYIHIPISITHSTNDTIVPVHHARDMRDAINSFNPDYKATVYENEALGCNNDNGHCYWPDPLGVMNFFEPFILNNTPTHINIASDESKSYYWLNLDKNSGDDFTYVEATYFPLTSTVIATVEDDTIDGSNPLDVGFNLGSTPAGSTAGVEQPGMGLPATTYLVSYENFNELVNYSSGYLTVILTNNGITELSISSITKQIVPDTNSLPEGQQTIVDLTATLTDQLGNPVPDDTQIWFLADRGTFNGGGTTFSTIISGGQGQAMATLTTDGPTNITVTLSPSAIYLPIVIKNN